MTFLLKKEIGRAKTEKKKTQAKNAMKSFSTMVKYCESGAECRHGAFSKFFGDKVHECKDKCDVCNEPKIVKKRIEDYQKFLVQREGARMGSLVMTNGDFENADPDLYEGGRRGTKRNFDETYDNSDGDESVERAEKKAKKEREEMIKGEFAKRKGNLSKKNLEEKEKEKKNQEKEALLSAKVKGAEFTSKKISGLELTQRESYLSLLETVIRQNYDRTGAAEEYPGLTNFQVQKLAIEAEYKIFRENKVVTMYRRGMAFLMAEVKGKTDKFHTHDLIKSHFDANVSWQENSSNYSSLLDRYIFTTFLVCFFRLHLNQHHRKLRNKNKSPNLLKLKDSKVFKPLYRYQNPVHLTLQKKLQNLLSKLKSHVKSLKWIKSSKN